MPLVGDDGLIRPWAFYCNLCRRSHKSARSMGEFIYYVQAHLGKKTHAKLVKEALENEEFDLPDDVQKLIDNQVDNAWKE